MPILLADWIKMLNQILPITKLSAELAVKVLIASFSFSRRTTNTIVLAGGKVTKAAKKAQFSIFESAMGSHINRKL